MFYYCLQLRRISLCGPHSSGLEEGRNPPKSPKDSWIWKITTSRWDIIPPPHLTMITFITYSISITIHFPQYFGRFINLFEIKYWCCKINSGALLLKVLSKMDNQLRHVELFQTIEVQFTDLRIPDWAVTFIGIQVIKLYSPWESTHLTCCLAALTLAKVSSVGICLVAWRSKISF